MGSSLGQETKGFKFVNSEKFSGPGPRKLRRSARISPPEGKDKGPRTVRLEEEADGGRASACDEREGRLTGRARGRPSCPRPSARGHPSGCPCTGGSA